MQGCRNPVIANCDIDMFSNVYFVPPDVTAMNIIQPDKNIVTNVNNIRVWKDHQMLSEQIWYMYPGGFKILKKPVIFLL